MAFEPQEAQESFCYHTRPDRPGDPPVSCTLGTGCTAWSVVPGLLHGLLYRVYYMVCCTGCTAWFVAPGVLHGLLHWVYCMVCCTGCTAWSVVPGVLHGLLYRVSFVGEGSKAVWGWHCQITPSSAKAKERVQLYIYPLLCLLGMLRTTSTFTLYD